MMMKKQLSLKLATSTVAAAIAVIVSDLYCQGFQLQQQQRSSIVYSSSTSPWSTNGRRLDFSTSSSSSSSSSSSALNYLQGEDEQDQRQRQRQHQSFAEITTTTNVEDILGGNYQWNANEYDRDAEFYRRRNEEYTREINEDNVAMSNGANIGLGLGGAVLDASAVTVTVTSNNKKKSTSTSTSTSASPFSQDPRDYWVVDAINTSLTPLYTSFKYVERNTLNVLQTAPLLALGIFVIAGLFVAYISGFIFLDGYIENINPATNDMIPYWNEADIHTIQRVPLPLPTMK